ncbi:MAG: PKD domain-containing protein [Candidatus Bathyarchaeota archaeon]|nr:PKD domain-containing protein [Candidatus Bathyarchaeota archaeon]
MKRRGNKGTSTIFGSILLIILVLTLAAVLFLTLYRYNHSVQAAIKFEEERTQERIVLYRLETQNLSETEYVYAIFVNNTGSITSRIRAVYVDNEFLCDPSNNTINPDDTYINPKARVHILLPPGVIYEPTAKMTVATERGMKSTEYEWKLKLGGEPSPPYEVKGFYFGPLMLDFNKFYYTECDPSNGSYDPSTWKAGWAIEIGTGSIAWNITVKNVDDRNITINQFSCFTLFPNKSPSNRRAWYIEPLQGSFTQFIAVNKTVNIIYIWQTPKMKQMKPQSIYTTVCRNKVFLTFFGIFHEKDGTTKPYGQTIPFEAVLCVRTGGTIDISAWPSIILANSTMNSTITAKVYNVYGNPVANANVTFSTDLGTLSSLWAITDANGTATLMLYPSSLPGLADVTATWEGLSRSVTVIMNGRPVASFTESAETVYTGEEISFNASDSYDPDGLITSYFWDFGDDTNATGVATNHSYVDDGSYTVTLTVTDDRGATASTSATKTILNRSLIASFTESAETVYTNEPISFNASASFDPDGTIVSYFWDFGDGTNTTGATATHSYADNGIYTVTLTVTDDDGAMGSNNATKTVLNRPPIASFAENATVMLTGESIHFNASASYDQDGSIVSYFWDFGDGTNETGVAVDHSYADNGTYTVTLTIIDDNGGTDSINAAKYVLNRLPIANFTESAETVNTGESISFDASASYDQDGTIVSYFWDFGDGTNSTGVTTSHAYISDGTYTVTLTVTDNDDATASTTATKTILPSGGGG